MDLPREKTSPKLIQCQVIEKGTIPADVGLIHLRLSLGKKLYKTDMLLSFGVAFIEHFLQVQKEAILIFKQLVTERVEVSLD